jgi:hypothetical protein
VAMTGLMALLAGVPAVAGETAAASVEVSARLWGETSLYFSLVLRHPKRLDVPLDSLPWGAFPDLQMVAVRAEDGVVLPRTSSSGEPAESPVTKLVAGQDLHGRVPLTEVADDLAEALRVSDVIVFWSFRLRVPGASPSNRTGGWVVVPRVK